SGIYYAPGSVKARTCRRGIGDLLAFADEYDIPYEICGKLIVATTKAEIPRLESLENRGRANGLKGLKRIPADGIADYEPHVKGLAALWVPETGIIDYTLVTEKLRDDVIRRGGIIVYEAPVTNLIADGSEWILVTEQDTYAAGSVITCAGLQSDTLARATETDLDMRILPFRGEYYTLKSDRRDVVRNLIYPVPDPRYPFLGVHFTRRITGEVEAGPNAVLALKKEGYGKWDVSFPDLGRMMGFKGAWCLAQEHWKTGLAEQWRSWVKPAFVRALQKLIPELTAADITTGGSGVRAQAVDRQGKLLDDFYFLRRDNLLHVINAPSPAATASLAIARQIVSQLNDGVV
ncbi:MAG: L-2-hydroxyglutarate oxidase, partial [Fidelibacterota bacterium]